MASVWIEVRIVLPNRAIVLPTVLTIPYSRRSKNKRPTNVFCSYAKRGVCRHIAPLSVLLLQVSFSDNNGQRPVCLHSKTISDLCKNTTLHGCKRLLRSKTASFPLQKVMTDNMSGIVQRPFQIQKKFIRLQNY